MALGDTAEVFPAPVLLGVVLAITDGVFIQRRDKQLQRTTKPSHEIISLFCMSPHLSSHVTQLLPVSLGVL